MVPQDAELVLRMASEADTDIAMEATKTALVLAPGESGSACLLLQSPKPAIVKLAMLSLIDCDPSKVWPQIEKRLYDANEEIRKLVCAYAIKKFPIRHLTKLLDTYLSEDRYFYNVVYFLDRAIYAKLPLRKLLVEEIEAVLT